MTADALDEGMEIFAGLLEQSGCTNSLTLVYDEIQVIAKRQHLSLYDAAWVFASNEETEDRPPFRLHTILHKVASDELQRQCLIEPL